MAATLPAVVLEQYEDTKQSITYYFDSIKSQATVVNKYALKSFDEIDLIKKQRLDELEHISALTLLSGMEAMLQDDYSERVIKRKKSVLSRQVRNNFKKLKIKKNCRPTLDRDIFPIWKEHLAGSDRECIIKTIECFQYRHWLAHGRYWVWKHGKIPQFYEISVLAELLEDVLPKY